ncbi:NAD-dependent epimerase/dehydratase family protein [Fusibacter ferrireducens]|uniref:NAD-dependent epimerase/dehydratase family protein n=1 Tax=Fusibacter ferrireducens TaxID=2785058 RepID=A0ABR9ZXF6_9FIRM|nr:NAD-dependent epimerase/dehydratase family protein [Fusibacter ferrireducens]MBF4695144.1 NAD-dependent epimerase/dehydratase family protein [Fusibacter ferrireducens]
MLLVTGITGHTGRYFLQELMDHKYEGAVRCIVRETSDTYMLDNCGLNIEKIYGDLNDQEFMNKCIKNVETIMHIAGIQNSVNVVTAANFNKVKNVVLVHTTGIYSKYKSASELYQNIEDEIKLLTEKSDHKLNIIILRPTMIYGDLCDLNMSKFIKMVDRLRLFPVINGGTGLIQPVNARSLGRAYFLVLKNLSRASQKEYIISGEKPISMKEAFKLISLHLNKKTCFINVPVMVGVALAYILKVASLGKIDFVEKVQRMAEDRSFSHELARKDFGYIPIEFKEGIGIEVKQFLEKKK